jgi:hypothetical protein
MSVKKHIEDSPDQMKLMGGIITCLNRIENCINGILSSPFVSVNTENQHKMCFVSRILAHQKIFCQIEEKRLMLIELIEEADYLIKSNKLDISFNKEKYKQLAKELQKIQTIRNEIAHNYILTNTDGFGEYYKAKKPGELLQEREIKSSFKTKKIDLQRAQDESIILCDKLESLAGEMIIKFVNIFNS